MLIIIIRDTSYLISMVSLPSFALFTCIFRHFNFNRGDIHITVPYKNFALCTASTRCDTSYNADLLLSIINRPRIPHSTCVCGRGARLSQRQYNMLILEYTQATRSNNNLIWLDAYQMDTIPKVFQLELFFGNDFSRLPCIELLGQNASDTFY